MCGITGIWSIDIGKDDIQDGLRKAVAALRHRGPDDSGTWTGDSGIALGHTRLSILDLSECAHQPMVSYDGRHVIVFNGEIYNFAAIRKELSDLGHTFVGKGDTEVILHAFQEWGSDAVARFIGMFAIAVWDAHARQLELVRDRIGVKPLYYHWDGRTLCFGSELKAIRAYTHWKPEIDLRSVGEFLQYGYISEDRTIYAGVSKLRPGHRLRLIDGGSPSTERYWSILDAPRRSFCASDEEIESELENLLIDAFKSRMVSDVPVGVYLSGGIDSSLVAAILAKHHPQTIRTFTIGFAEDSHDESRWAKKVAQHCGTQHTEYILSVEEALSMAKQWGGLFDEPFGDSSGIPTLLVSRLASEEVKVVLSADGGDELFSGYQRYTSVLNRMQQLSRFPSAFRMLGFAGLSVTPPRIPESGLGRSVLSPVVRGAKYRKIDRLRKIIRRPTAGNMMDIYASYWYPSEIKQLIGQYEPTRSDADEYDGTAAQRLSLWDFHHYLPEDILTKVDRTTMAVSIEGREPLLDHRLAEYAFALPPQMTRGELGPKHALKSILYRYVPRSLVDRPKQGFAIPLQQWLRADLKHLVDHYLSDTQIRDGSIMDVGTVQHVVRRFQAGDDNLTHPLWFLLAFEMWRDTWM